MSAPITVWPENLVRFAKQEIENREVGEAIQRAARDLPEGYRVVIDIEREGGTVDVVLPDGTEEKEYPSNHERLSESIADALQYAQEHAKQNAQVTP